MVFNVKYKTPATIKQCAMIYCANIGKPRAFRHDNGGEFSGGPTAANPFAHEFQAWCLEQGIVSEPTMAYTPEENGGQERQWRTLEGMARAMLMDSGLDDSFWPFAMLAANYCKNRTPSRVIDFQTPIGKLQGCKPSVDHLRIFGCAAWVHIDQEKRRDKLAARAFRGVFVGYDTITGGYYVFDPPTRKIVRSRNVIFDESMKGGDVINCYQRGPARTEVPSSRNDGDDDDSDDDHDEDDECLDPVGDGSSPAAQEQDRPLLPQWHGAADARPHESVEHEGAVAGVPQGAEHDAPHETDTTDGHDRQHQVSRSRRGRVLQKPREFWKAVTHHVEVASSVPVPRTYQQALQWDAAHWTAAMEQELRSQVELGTWKVVPRNSLPEDQHIIGKPLARDKLTRCREFFMWCAK
jgi:hypothetical protein